MLITHLRTRSINSPTTTWLTLRTTWKDSASHKSLCLSLKKDYRRLFPYSTVEVFPEKESLCNSSSSTVVTPLGSTEVSDSAAEVAFYAASGGRITQFSAFCSDPLEGNPRLISARMEAFRRDFGNGSELFARVVNGDYRHFQRAVLGTIEQTRHLHTLI